MGVLSSMCVPVASKVRQPGPDRIWTSITRCTELIVNRGLFLARAVTHPHACRVMCFPCVLVCTFLCLPPILRLVRSVTFAVFALLFSPDFILTLPLSAFGAQVGVVGEDRKFRILSEQEVKDFLDEAN